MQVVMTQTALAQLKAVHRFLSDTANEAVAQKMLNTLGAKLELLALHPTLGQKEPYLAYLGHEHRYIRANDLKIIYRQLDDETIAVTDVCDIHQ